MAFQRVVCEIIFKVYQQYTDGEGRPTGKGNLIGDYETQRDAEQALADNGFTRKSWGWVGHYQVGSYVRVLKEIDIS